MQMFTVILHTLYEKKSQINSNTQNWIVYKVRDQVTFINAQALILSIQPNFLVCKLQQLLATLHFRSHINVGHAKI